MQRFTHKIVYNINDIRLITCKIAHNADGFGHGAYIFKCNMNEYCISHE